MLKTMTGSLPRAVDNSSFLISETKLALLRLKQAFTKAFILHHFDPECYIQIEIDVFGYTIGGILSQLTLEIGQWHPTALFFRKMILAETWYKTHDQEFLVLVEAFKIWRHYLEGCKFEVLVFINYYNLCRFMDTKNLYSRQVFWAQKLSWYHFQINYCQGKVNITTDTLSHFPQRYLSKEEKLQAENTQIFHQL